MAVEITIDPEFAQLCRALTAEEREQLEANLKAEGRCADATAPTSRLRPRESVPRCRGSRSG